MISLRFLVIFLVPKIIALIKDVRLCLFEFVLIVNGCLAVLYVRQLQTPRATCRRATKRGGVTRILVNV